MNQVKFSCFSDIHHCLRQFYTNAPERLAKIQQRAKENNVNFIIHCGDFAHQPRECPEFIAQYNNFEIPSYHVLGNHDSDSQPLEETIRLLGMPAEYYYFDKNGFRFICLNSNHCKINGEFIAYSEGNYYAHPQEREYISEEQIHWLRDVLMSSPYLNIIFSHNNLALEDVQSSIALRNRDDVQAVIREANESGHRVLMCINGHLHRDFLRIYENVCYLDINSASYEWTHDSHDFYPKEITDRYTLANHTVIYNDPVHAIITLSEDGTIEIEGMKSSFFMGIDREMVTGNHCVGGRKCTPDVLSAKLKLF